MSFKIASKFLETATVANSVPTESFELLLGEIFKRMGAESGGALFTETQKDKMLDMFDLKPMELDTLVDGCCYAFEQAAFTGTGTETLFNVLMEQASFDEAHAKVMGRFWAKEEKAFKARLKRQTLGSREMTDLNYYLNVCMGDSNMLRLAEATAIFEFSLNRDDSSLVTGIKDVGLDSVVTGLGSNAPRQADKTEVNGREAASVAAANTNTVEDNSHKFSMELTHGELFEWFKQLEKVQTQLDEMA
jgi:hypothetical protein